MENKNIEINLHPSLEEISEWSNDRIAWRAFFLGLICADRKTKKDESWQWADNELRKIVPLINKRFG